MTRLGWIDRLLLATLLPAFAIALFLHVREGQATGGQQIPVFAVRTGPDTYPVVGGLRHEVGGGPGEVRIGDVVRRVGRVDMRGAWVFDVEAHAYAEADADGRVLLEIEREGERSVVPLQLVRNPQPFYRVPFLLGAVAVGVAVLLRARERSTARLFYAAFVSFALFETPFYAASLSQTYAYTLLFHLVGPVSIALFMAAVRCLPAEVAEGERASLGWMSVALLFPIVRIPFFFGAPFPVEWTPTIVRLNDAFMMSSGIWIVLSNTRAAEPAGRRRMKWVLWGAMLGVLPITFVLGLQAFFPTPDLYRAFFQWTAMCAVFLPLGISMSVLRDNLFDIDRLLSSTATYAVFVGAAAALGLIASAPVARGVANATGLRPEVASVLAVAALVAIAIPIATRVRPIVEARLFPDRAALSRGLQQLLRDLSDCATRAELFELVDARLRLLVRPHSAAMLVAQRGELVAREDESLRMSARGALALRLESDPAPRTGPELRRLAPTLPVAEAALLDAMPVELLLPLRDGRRLAACLLLGPKRSGEPFVSAETTLLAAVAEKASGELARLRTLELAESERARADEARALMERADEANRAKSRFLAAASHDLRQPLHALGLFVERLARRHADDPLVAQIETSVTALSTQFDALLDLSRLDAGGVVPRPVEFALGPELARVAAEHAEAARAKGLALRFDPVDATVRSDPALLVRVLNNLLSNAIRYTRAGEVYLRTREQGGELAIEVIDTGPGIPPDQQRNIFAEFVQLEGGVRGEGLGLGLSIVDRTVRLLGHRLELESAPGEGSLFRVLVPLVERRAVARPAPSESASSLAGRRVLLVEDEESVRLAMHGLLESWGCEVTAVDSFEDAQLALGAEVSEASRPALVIADFALGGERTGLDVIRLVRDRAGLEVPAVIVSGEAAQRSRDAIRESGVPFLPKPVPPARLRALIGELLRGDG